MRRAISLTIDRQAFVDIIADGQGAIGGVMQPPPEGIWGMPPYAMRNLPGYDPDIAASRAKARKIMETLGYGPNNRLKVTLVDAQRRAVSRPRGDPDRPAEGDLYRRRPAMPIDTAQWYPTLTRKDFKIAMNVTETAVDDPDVAFYENYACGSHAQLYRATATREVDKLIDKQSAEANIEKRKKIVWEIEKKLIDDDARPILFYNKAANCRRPHLKGLTTQVNSIYNSWRFEDLWLDRASGSSSAAK